MKSKDDDSGFRLSSTFVHLDMSGKAREVEAGPDFFRSFKSRADLQNGRLMGALRISEGLSHWEMHPDGDEILYLLSGSVDVELEDEQRCIRLSDMTACVVPCGTWHRTVVHQPGKMIFITPGNGTQHREAE
jgi:mannose-6-phosphate isomerase-like protein (cupin superfamily)